MDQKRLCLSGISVSVLWGHERFLDEDEMLHRLHSHAARTRPARSDAEMVKTLVISLTSYGIVESHKYDSVVNPNKNFTLYWLPSRPVSSNQSCDTVDVPTSGTSQKHDVEQTSPIPLVKDVGQAILQKPKDRSLNRRVRCSKCKTSTFRRSLGQAFKPPSFVTAISRTIPSPTPLATTTSPITAPTTPTSLPHHVTSRLATTRTPFKPRAMFKDPHLAPLVAERTSLQKQVEGKEETMRRLRVLQNQAESGESEKLPFLISKWRDTCKKATLDYRAKLLETRTAGFGGFGAWESDAPPWGGSNSWGCDTAGHEDTRQVTTQT
ncbi:hypothetical protein M427DRAFT_54858 [Gonapodya prolifera JEL478]|uniref:Uncharacterized protein n=1 Tax=Gonapodya prolifera (strain JEL478) TaxID=1344416 RepID=A0A139AKA9_GONPJ|nr:hypothetical protein M427DRAFT_54858 [Gonapodya prolifera JEL478]|eukprot:KXS17209.1 hypothetical protein M427DRAFT_54858 [Gonapodya prolifera JEL478]